MVIRQKRLISFIVSIIALTLVAGTSAYYSSQHSVQNRLTVKGSEVLLSEVFNPADKWLPGETKEKVVAFGNSGESDQVLRVKVTEKWDFQWQGNYDPKPAVINWANLSEWTKIGDWYYYREVLKKQSGNTPTMTNPLIESVTFSNAISNADPGYKDDFSDRKFSLNVEMETVGVDSGITEDVWGVSFEKSGTSLAWRQ